MPVSLTRLGSILSIALGLSVSLAPGAATAANQRTDGRIAFQGCGDDGCQIYTVNPNGTALRQVTTTGVNFMPSWSPDGRFIAYAKAGDPGAAIWIVDAAGRRPRQVTPFERDSTPHFTPDGQRIVFSNFNADVDGSISVVRIDGTNEHFIEPNSGASYNDPVVSPNGHRIAVMRWHLANVHMAIYTLPRHGGQSHRVTPPALEGWAPGWSPDGTRILFSSHIFGQLPNGSIYSVRPDGTGLRKLTAPPFPMEDYEASWSPTGKRIVFSSDRRFSERFAGANLFVMRADGSHLHRIVLPASIQYAEWADWGPASLASEPVGVAPDPPQGSGNSGLRAGALCSARGAALVFAMCREQ